MHSAAWQPNYRIMANTGTTLKGKKRRVRVKVARAVAGPKKHPVLRRAAGSFIYRGLRIKPSFTGDARSSQLETAMREVEQREHVLTD